MERTEPQRTLAVIEQGCDTSDIEGFLSKVISVMRKAVSLGVNFYQTSICGHPDISVPVLAHIADIVIGC